jgi:cellulose synthase/poly-beta-1,6-N-acetylglucosamine synthase-like glycosyltransferase
LEDIDVIVGSDGSTDRTAEIVRGLANKYSQIKFFDLARSGKNKVLNELCRKATGEILFFLDADVRLSKNSISLMVENYEDKNVGAVLSSLINIPTDDNINIGQLGEDKYQKFERFIRKKESNIYSTIKQ